MDIPRLLRLSLFLGMGMVAPLAAQHRLPLVPGDCGARCGLIPAGQGGYMDCGPCLGICGDNICHPGIGETHANCPADCPGGPCVSEGCRDRCGHVRDQCGRLLACGACPSTCGDHICDPGEWIDCQDDCGRDCRPRIACGLRCGVVDDGCGSYVDCGPCGGLCGNGLCETGESNATCPEDCPPPGCVSTGCHGGCGAMVDNCGRQLDCGTCGAYSQCPHPNGVCELDLGEDQLNCRWECPIGCGDGICTLADRLRCPDDCAGAPPPDGISAGGPYAGLVSEAVHFFGLAAPLIAASGYQWTFGDGAGAEGLTPTHTYTAPGTYEVRLKATLLDGGELVSLTSARIAAQAGASGSKVGFEVHHDPFGDGISATATIGPDGAAPPGRPRRR